ncbi:Lectin C-type domain family protein [Acanthocheilonema viteae]
MFKIKDGATGRLCQEGWLYSHHTKYCYLLVTTLTTFNNAQFACLLKEANLVSIHSEIENRFLFEMVAKIGKSIWLGAAIFSNSKKYENVDFSPFDYTNWQNGTEPVYMKSRKCVKISSKNGKWFNDCCHYRPVPYICKKLARKAVIGTTSNKKNEK